MSSINFGTLFPKMLAAAQGPLKKQWPVVKDYVESEFKKIGESILFIETQRALGKMTDEQARLHLKLQTLASKNVLLAAEGLGYLAVEAAINAALAVVKDAINTALKFPLI